MEIRCLAEGDAQALWDLRRVALASVPEAFGESVEEHLRTTVESTAERLRSGGEDNFVVGAWSDSQLVGMAGFYRDVRLKRRHRGWIWGMYVAPEVRGRGVGRQLLEYAIRRAGQIPGLRYVLLSVSSEQAAARQLYVSCGFVPWGVERGALEVGGCFLDEEFMARRV